MVKKTDPDPPVRTSITLRRSLVDAVERYQGQRGLMTMADAYRELLQEALSRLLSPTAAAKGKGRTGE